MPSFKLTLPEDLFRKLKKYADKHSVHPDELIEQALRRYMDEINKEEYVTSYKKAAKDPDIEQIAEEGMDDYFKQLQQ
ncbi:MAG: CopG family transcriptional regulator [Chlorobi bacterium]|nr:CopG family transcriptional regulator [Chlorobiota bacterium]